MVAGFDIEAVQAFGGGDDQCIVIDPARGRNVGVEIPAMIRCMKPFAEDIEPEKLFARRVPKRSLSKRAFGRVVDHTLAA